MLTIIKEKDFSKFESISDGLSNQVLMRTTKPIDWFKNSFLNDRLSGTLKKNSRLGFVVTKQLYAEALGLTLGYSFESVPRSYVTVGDAISECDCSAITEAGWYSDRMMAINPFDDKYEVKYVVVHSKESGTICEGIALVLVETSVQWINNGNLVFAMIAEYNPITKDFNKAINPF